MVKKFLKEDGWSTTDLLQAARFHLASAEVLFEESLFYYFSAGYLGHLGIELILKAFLLHFTGHFPNEHDLQKLMNQIQSVKKDLRLDADHSKILAHINQFKSMRYPEPKDPIEIGYDDWMAIQHLVTALISIMPPELEKEFSEPI